MSCSLLFVDFNRHVFMLTMNVITRPLVTVRSKTFYPCLVSSQLTKKKHTGRLNGVNLCVKVCAWWPAMEGCSYCIPIAWPMFPRWAPAVLTRIKCLIKSNPYCVHTVH